MWGTLARQVTDTVKETASSAAASVAPHAGDVLRRVGEVVAPPTGGEEGSYDDDDDDDYEDEDDDGSCYSEEEDGVYFEDKEEGGEAGEGAGASPDLDRYRKMLFDPAAGAHESATNDPIVAAAPTSAADNNCGASESKISNDWEELLPRQQQQHAEAEAMRWHAEEPRSALNAKEAAEVEIERERARIQNEKEQREEGSRKEWVKMLKEKTRRAMQAELAEAERREKLRAEAEERRACQ